MKNTNSGFLKLDFFLCLLVCCLMFFIIEQTQFYIHQKQIEGTVKEWGYDCSPSSNTNNISPDNSNELHGKITAFQVIDHIYGVSPNNINEHYQKLLNLVTKDFIQNKTSLLEERKRVIRELDMNFRLENLQVRQAPRELPSQIKSENSDYYVEVKGVIIGARNDNPHFGFNVEGFSAYIRLTKVEPTIENRYGFLVDDIVKKSDSKVATEYLHEYDAKNQQQNIDKL